MDQQTFRFFSLPIEIRRMIYLEVLSDQCLILGDHLTKAGTFFCGNRYWHYGLIPPPLDVDSSLSILLSSRQTFMEVRPLLAEKTPRHFAFSKLLHSNPQYSMKELTKLGIPFNSITTFTFNALILGTDPNSHHKTCNEDGQHMVMSSWHGFEEDVPPNLVRPPNLFNFYQMTNMLETLPALRRVHVFDTLRPGFVAFDGSCKCPIAGTASCVCGQCACDCNFYEPLPALEGLECAEAAAIMQKAILSRLRAALPVRRDHTIYRSSGLGPNSSYDARRLEGCYALLNILAHGVDIFMHDEVKHQLPGSDLSVWRTTYHLAAPKDAVMPHRPVSQLVETPGEFRRRMGREEELRRAQPYDFRSSSFHIEKSVRDLPEEFEVKPLIAYESGFEIKVSDEDAAERDLHWKWC